MRRAPDPRCGTACCGRARTTGTGCVGGDFGNKKKGTFRVIKVRSTWRRPDDPRPKVNSLVRDVPEYQRREGSRLIGAVAHANETLRTIADRVTLNEGTDLHLVPGDACLLARACARTCEEQVSATCTLCAGDLGGDLYVVLSVARTNVEDTLFEAVRVAQKLGLKLDEVLLEAIIGDGAPPGQKPVFKPVKGEAPVPTKRPFSPPKSVVDESRPPSRGTAERWSELSSTAAPAPAPPSSVDVAMTLVGRSALLHRGTYVRDRNVRFYKARYEEDPDDKPRSAGPASSLQLERAGAAVQDLLYALLMLDSLLDAGPPLSPQECIERARHLELGREHQKYLAGRRADLKLGREPKAEQVPEVGVEEEKRPQTPPPPPARPPGAATPAAEAIAAMPAGTPEERKEKATKTFGGMLSAARGFMRSGSRERKTRPRRGAWQRPSSRENSSRESSAERSRPGSRESSVEPPPRRTSRLRAAGNAVRSFGRRGRPPGKRSSK